MKKIIKNNLPKWLSLFCIAVILLNQISFNVMAINDDPDSSNPLMEEPKETDNGGENGDEFMVTFVMGAGIEDKSISVKSLSDIEWEELVPPDIAGCEFMGWYLDSYLTTPYEEEMLFSDDLTLYAGYRSDGTTFSSYQSDLASDSEFILFSQEQITPETLNKYVQFDDVYDDTVIISMEEIEAIPDLSEEMRQNIQNILQEEGLDTPEEPLTGKFRYRLYAEDGFGSGRLYGFTVLQPEIVRFLSVNNISLVGNDAAQLNFKIFEEKLDNRQMNADVIQVSLEDVHALTPINDYTFSAEMDATADIQVGSVFGLPNADDVGTTYYKVLSVDQQSDDSSLCTFEYASSSDVWDEYELTFDMDDMTATSVDLYEDAEEEMAHEIVTSIGYAAYVDAVLDGIKKSPEVIEQLNNVSQEEHDEFMNLTAIDLGFGPEDLQDQEVLSVGSDRYGKISFDLGETDDGRPKVTISFESKEIEFKLGKNKKSGLEATVKLQFELTEVATLQLYGQTIALDKAKYPSMKEDFTQTGVVPDSTTTFSFTATLALGKDEAEDEDSMIKKIETDLGIEYEPSDDGSETTITVAEESYDLWKYVKNIQSQRQADDSLFDVDLDYVNIIEKPIGKMQFTSTGVESIQIEFKFVVGIAAQVQLSANISYEYMGDYYTTNGRCKFENGRIVDIVSYEEPINGARTLYSNLNINVLLKGGIGIRAGLAVNVNFSAFQLNSIASIGLEVEVGPYAELTGYFGYSFNKTSGQVFNSLLNMDNEEYSSTSHTFAGGAKFSIGIYVDMKATVKFFRKTWEIPIASLKFPIWEKTMGGSTAKGLVYGGFMDESEILDFSDNSLDLYSLDKSSNAIFKSKQRSTMSDTPYQLEIDSGLYRSSGLKLLRSDLSSSSSDSVKEAVLPRGQYDYRITQIVLDEYEVSERRGLDGNLRKDEISYINSEDIAKYALLLNFGDASMSGNLIIMKDAPNMMLKILVRAKNVENVFTGMSPTKTIYVYYNGSSVQQPEYNLNFYDTDGNLLVQDTYQSGDIPIGFAEPGYICEGNNFGSVSVGISSDGEYDYKADAKNLYKKGTYESGFDTTVSNYWGYNSSDWDFDSAFWSDVPMSSPTAGNKMTATSVGPMTKDVNVYLHMDCRQELKASWVLNWSNPDKPSDVIPETIKTATYKYGQIESLRKANPDLSGYTRINENTERGIREHFTNWQETGESNKTTQVQIKEISKLEQIGTNRYYYFQVTKNRTVPRLLIQANTVYAEAAAKFDFIWKNVYFNVGSERLAVKTMVGDVPVVPAAFKDYSIKGWLNYDTNREYTELPPLAQSTKAIEYYAMSDTKKMIFDTTGVGNIQFAFISADTFSPNVLYSTINGGRWKYLPIESNTILHFEYKISERAISGKESSLLAPLIKLPENILWPTDKQHPANEITWRSTEPVNGKYIDLKPSQGINPGIIVWSDKEIITFKPVVSYRGVTVTLKGTAEKFNLQDDIAFTTYKKAGETLTMEEIDDILSYRNNNAEYRKNNYYYRYITSLVDNGLPYTFGSGDNADGIVLVDQLEISCSWTNTTHLYLDGGKLADGTTGTITKNGSSLDTLDLSPFTPISPRTELNPDGFSTDYDFIGWRNTKTDKIVTSVTYGEDAIAQWKAGDSYFNLTMHANEGTFADGSITKMIRFDKNKTLAEQNGYEEPKIAATSGYVFSHWVFANDLDTEVPGDSNGQFFEYRTGDLVAVYEKASAIKVKDYHGIYDAKPHTLTASLNLENATLQYSIDQINWVSEAPLYTEAGTYYVYVRAVQNEVAVSETFKGIIEIAPIPDVTVTITGNQSTAIYDGTEHKIDGYKFSADNSLFTETYVSFNGDAKASRTNVGTTYMGLTSELFVNISNNFKDVTFKVSDGYQTIDPKSVSVTADDKTWAQGTVEPELTATVTGLIGSDKITYTLSCDQNGKIGTYRISITGDEKQGNYSVTFTDGWFKITDPETIHTVTYKIKKDLLEMITAPSLRLTDGDTPTGDPWDGANDVVTFDVVSGKTIGDANAIVSVWEYSDEGIPSQISDAAHVVFLVNGTAYSASELRELSVTENMSIEVNLLFIDITFTLSDDLPKLSGPKIYVFNSRDPGKNLSEQICKDQTLADIPDIRIGTWIGFYQYGAPLSSNDIYFDIGGTQLSWQDLSNITFSEDTLITVHIRKVNVTFTIDDSQPYTFGSGTKSFTTDIFWGNLIMDDAIPAVYQDDGDIVNNELVSYYINNELSRDTLLGYVFDSNITIPVLVRDSTTD